MSTSVCSLCDSGMPEILKLCRLPYCSRSSVLMAVSVSLYSRCIMSCFNLLFSRIFHIFSLLAYFSPISFHYSTWLFPYFSYHFTIQPTFLPYFPYLFTISLLFSHIISLFNLAFSIFFISFHYSTYFSPVFSISFHY